MSGFSSQWLALREPYDRRARNPEVLASVTKAFRGQTAVSIVDLACGTGSTLRAIGSSMPARQAWRLVDNDLGLLAQAADLGRPPHVTVTPSAIDLVRDLEMALDGPLDLVTTSALLDLVSSDWIERLAVEAAARRLPVYAALTYRGSATIEPTDPFDFEILAAVNRHQRRDKGFGPALGPEAALRTVKNFERVGYTVQSGASDWMLGPEDQAIQLAVLTGWAASAGELGELPETAVGAWLARRRVAVVNGVTMRIGHTDVFAMPVLTR